MVGQQFECVGGLVGFQVCYYDCDDLWVFVVYQVGYGMWVYLFQCVQVGGVVVEQDVVDQIVGFFVVQCLYQYVVDVVV